MQSGRKIGFEQAEELEQWMKENAPWTDRTGAAREALYARFIPEERAIGTVQFGYDPEVTYAVWLEIAHQGQWSILRPAQDVFGPKLRQSLKRIANLGLIRATPEGYFRLAEEFDD